MRSHDGAAFPEILCLLVGVSYNEDLVLLLELYVFEAFDALVGCQFALGDFLLAEHALGLSFECAALCFGRWWVVGAVFLVCLAGD